MNMKQAIKKHKEQDRHFFDIAAMRFFNSRLESELIDDYYFITSEQYGDKFPRYYSIRKFYDQYNSINTIGKFQEYLTKSQAIKGLKTYLEKNIDTSLYQNFNDSTVIDKCYETIQEFFTGWKDVNSVFRRYFRCFLDGSYHDETRYKQNIEQIKLCKKSKTDTKIKTFIRRQLFDYILTENKSEEWTASNLIKTSQKFWKDLESGDDIVLFYDLLKSDCYNLIEG